MYMYNISMIELTTLTSKKETKLQTDRSSEQSYEKIFQFQNKVGECRYENMVNCQIIGNQKSTNNIKIMNKLCNDKDNVLQKITSIKFNNQIINIKDYYYFSSPNNKFINHHHNNNNTSKRIHILKKRLVQPAIERSFNNNYFNNSNNSNNNHYTNNNHTPLTKNLPKNFIKAFLNYLQNIKNPQNQQRLTCKIGILKTMQKYNNSFIQKIIYDEQLCPYFNDFLINHAREWIQNSKISNKYVHMSAIKVFLRLIPTNKKQKLSNINYSQQLQQITKKTNNQIQIQRQSIVTNSSKSNDISQI